MREYVREIFQNFASIIFLPLEKKNDVTTHILAFRTILFYKIYKNYKISGKTFRILGLDSKLALKIFYLLLIHESLCPQKNQKW